MNDKYSTTEGKTSEKLSDEAMLSAQWKNIDWHKAEREVNRLQIRIVKATQQKDYNAVKRLQYLLTHSFYAKALAVKRVVTNDGRKTPGVDGVLWNTPAKKMKAVLSLTDKGYRARPLRRVYIEKKDKKKKRPLGIPTMYDRAMQALYALALEPVAETTADGKSFGFRKGRCAQDACEYLFNALSRKHISPKWVLEGDIKGCFDHISHDWLLANIPMDKNILKQFLKAGFIYQRELFPTEEGTPQGGIISPILANMTLDGIEKKLVERFHTNALGKVDLRFKNAHKVNFVRYADDFVVTAATPELALEAKELIREFLAERGLELSDEKTVVTNIDDGFDFLGWNFRKYNEKLIIKPSKKAVKAMFLKAGYMEDWNFHETYSGCPQGGIISPILANIYLNELDRYIMQLKKEFDHGYNPRNFTEEYNTIRHKRDALHEKIKKAEGTMREQLIAQHKQLTKQLFRTPAKACTDKRLKYVRYADDFLIAVNGTREECEAIKAKLTDFVRDTLKMELSQEKTLITHSNTPARFLGFDVRVRRDASVKRSGKRKMRTMNNKVELNIPLKDKVETYLLSHSIAERDGKRLIPIHRPILLNRTDLEIVMIYNAELRGLCNYYAIASNFNKLVYFGYLMEYSCLKTLANKHRSRIAKVRYEYRDGTGAWGVPYETKKGKRRMMFAKYSDCKGKDLTEKVPDLAYRYSHNTTSFEERLKAKVCEVCGCTDSDSYEIHHVNKVKNLKGKADWEKVMLAKRRKTIVVCHKCHMRIHHGTKTE